MFKTGHLSRFIYFVFYTIVIFFYIYQVNLSFLGLPAAIHSRRIAAVILVFSALFFKRKRTIKEFVKPVYSSFKHYLFYCVFLLLFSYIQLIEIGKAEGVHMFDTMLNIVLFGLPVFGANTRIFSGLDDFMHILVYVTIIQTFFIIACFYNDAFATLMDLTFNYSGDDLTQRLRSGYAGGVGCIAAPGAILYSVGLFACSYLYIHYKKNIYLALLVIFFIVSAILARTGLIFDIVCFLYIILERGGLRKSLNFVLPGVVVAFIAVSIILSNSESTSLSGILQRYTNLKENGFREDFYDGYSGSQNTYYPDLSLDTFWGTGMMSGKSGRGDIVNVDGGPLRVYSAIGLFLALVSYVLILRIFIQQSLANYKRNKDYLLAFFSIFLLLSDFKEPTLFSPWSMTFFFTLAFLIRVDKSRRSEIIKYL